MTREEAIKKLNVIKEYLTAGNPIWDVREIDEVLDMAIEKLQALPPAQPERKKGKWIYGNGNGECPFCGHERQHGRDNFCGNCGADMRGEK